MADKNRIEKIWKEEAKKTGAESVPVLLNKRVRIVSVLDPVMEVVVFPTESGRQPKIEYLWAKGGRGGGKGRELVDLTIRVAQRLGYETVEVTNGSAYWDLQNDFEPTNRNVDNDDVTHVRKLR